MLFLKKKNDLKQFVKLIAGKTVLDIGAGERVLILSEQYNDYAQSLGTLQREEWKQCSSFVEDFYKELLNLNYHVTFCKYLGGVGVGVAVEPPKKVWDAVFSANIVGKLLHSGIFQEIKQRKLSLTTKNKLYATVASFDRKKDVIIYFGFHSIGNTIMKDLFTDVQKGRLLSLGQTCKESLVKNYKSLQNFNKVNESIVEKLDIYDTFTVKSQRGTDLVVYKNENKFLYNNTSLMHPGSFGMFPMGKVYACGKECIVNGVFVLDEISGKHLTEPIKVQIENNKVVKVEGDKRHIGRLESLRKDFHEHLEIKFLGFGTNEYANRNSSMEAHQVSGSFFMFIALKNENKNKRIFDMFFTNYEPNVYGYFSKQKKYEQIIKGNRFFPSNVLK